MAKPYAEVYCAIAWEAERHNVELGAVLQAIRTIQNDEWRELFDRAKLRYSQRFVEVENDG